MRGEGALGLGRLRVAVRRIMLVLFDCIILWRFLPVEVFPVFVVNCPYPSRSVHFLLSTTDSVSPVSFCFFSPKYSFFMLAICVLFYASLLYRDSEDKFLLSLRLGTSKSLKIGLCVLYSTKSESFRLFPISNFTCFCPSHMK